MVPLAPFRSSGVLKNALTASGSVFSDTAACQGSLRVDFSAARPNYPAGTDSPAIRRTIDANNRRVIYKVVGDVKWNIA
jgi:hypothetical protein